MKVDFSAQNKNFFRFCKVFLAVEPVFAGFSPFKTTFYKVIFAIFCPF